MAISKWMDWVRGTAPDFTSFRDPAFATKTEKTTTVFSGNPEDWQGYLNLSWDERRDQALFISLSLDPDKRRIRFKPENETSRLWAGWMDDGLRKLVKRLKADPEAFTVFEEMVFGNDSNFSTPLHLHASSRLPSHASREIRFDNDLEPEETDIVFQESLLRDVAVRMSQHGKGADDAIVLGILWPVLSRLVTQLGYPSYPRDRFGDRIHLTARECFLTLRLLFGDRSKGTLVPSRMGQVHLKYVSRKTGVRENALVYQVAYFRMLNDLGFLLKDGYFETHQEAVLVIVRDYLDQKYLRISLSGVMPGLLEWMAPMEYEYKKKKKVVTPSPQIGKFGILDAEDYSAWKGVQGPLKDAGFHVIRQLGIGQFGRVYEAVNLKNANIPKHVAIKVDRIRKGKKKDAIQAVDTIMEISRGLSRCPHVIRIHDAGRLKEIKSTYHILQLVNGDTLDHLIGVAGVEHASMYRPPISRISMNQTRRDYLKAMNTSHGELWRGERASLPFTDPLSLSQALDIVTSTLLWLEEVHQIGFAINDLKNGNLMISRRGQLKGIDLDTYSPVGSPLDKLPDFFFLAVTLLLFVLRVFSDGGDDTREARGLLGDIPALEKHLRSIWRFGDLSSQSGGRVESGQILQWILQVIDQSRNGTFAHEPGQFTACIDDLIHLKRSLVNEEMVLD